MQIYRLANTRRKEFLVHKTDHKIILSTKYVSLGHSIQSFTAPVAFRAFALFAIFTIASILHDSQQHTECVKMYGNSF